MMTLNVALGLADFLGPDMTDAQASNLMDQCKESLSIAEMQILKDTISGPMYTQASMYDAEMGGLSRY